MGGRTPRKFLSVRPKPRCHCTTGIFLLGVDSSNLLTGYSPAHVLTEVTTLLMGFSPTRKQLWTWLYCWDFPHSEAQLYCWDFPHSKAQIVTPLMEFSVTPHSWNTYQDMYPNFLIIFFISLCVYFHFVLLLFGTRPGSLDTEPARVWTQDPIPVYYLIWLS